MEPSPSQLSAYLLSKTNEGQRKAFRRAIHRTNLFKRTDSIIQFLSLNHQQNTIHFLVRKRKLIKTFLAILAGLLLILLLLETELYYGPGEDSWNSYMVLFSITIFTFLFAVSKILSILFYHQILIVQNLRSHRERYLTPSLLGTFALYMVHPVALLREVSFTSRASYPEIEFQRPLNDYLTLFQTFILGYEILTYILYDLNRREETMRVRIRRDHIVNPKTFFLKYYLANHPLRFILMMISYGALHLSYLMKIAESPEPIRTESGLFLWANCLWLSFVTMLTIGYGDFHPVTYQGRITAISTGIFGYICFSLVLTAISQMNRFSYSERGMVKALNWSDLNKKNRVCAANVIIRFSRLFLHIAKGREHLYLKDKTAFEAAIIMFKESRLAISQAKEANELLESHLPKRPAANLPR